MLVKSPPVGFTSTLKDFEFLHEQAANGDVDGIGSKKDSKYFKIPV